MPIRAEPAMIPCVVMVDVHLWPGNHETFRKHVDDHARTTVATEPACLHFDVIEPDGQPNTVLLYTVYAGRAAFEAHLASDHHRAFAAAIEPLCASQTSTFGRLVAAGAG